MNTRNMISRTALILAVFGLGACASSGQYVAAEDADDVGHYSTKLADNRYRVGRRDIDAARGVRAYGKTRCDRAGQ